MLFSEPLDFLSALSLSLGPQFKTVTTLNYIFVLPWGRGVGIPIYGLYRYVLWNRVMVFEVLGP